MKASVVASPRSKPPRYGRLPQVSGPLQDAMRGAGLGLRRELLAPLLEDAPPSVGFLEIAPENWMQVGGRLGHQFRALTERYPFVAHGLSLSIGGPAPLDEDFVREVGAFLDAHGIADYSEHLSWCGDEGHLYELLPIPFTQEAVMHVAARVRRVQDLLGRRIALENASYYAALSTDLSEIEFLNAVLESADCDLLLDVNNLYVNARNHGYDAQIFLAQLPAARIRYLHVAGHYVEPGDAAQVSPLLVDTHGTNVVDPVWQLLAQTYARFGVKPTLLERDFHIPPLPTLLREVEMIHDIQARVGHLP